jgi:phosphoribosylaminoimidazole carboxylase (NCAIR synthetase)
MDKQKIQIIIGLIIITLLFTTITMYIQDKQRDKEIISNCGFTQKDWTCVCTQEALDDYNNQVNLSEIIQKDYK